MKTPYTLTLLAALLAGGCAISPPAQERLDARAGFEALQGSVLKRVSARIISAGGTDIHRVASA